MTIAEQVEAAGVVGAGGGGFPTHVKLKNNAEVVIANGAECEPLLHKDATVMENYANTVIRGMILTMQTVGAKKGIIGIKEKNTNALKAIEAACEGQKITIHLLEDYYPAGDEFDLVYETTGKLIPPQGIPLHVGVVVLNVETLLNIAMAVDCNNPVIRKTLTIAGAINTPLTLNVRIGTTLREAINYAGGPTTTDPVLSIGGLMMGTITNDPDIPITKTTAGIIILPKQHPLIIRKLQSENTMASIGKSACDQCRYCTELCPRYLLGYSVQPHQVMQHLGFTASGTNIWNRWAYLCCACGLCTLYSCPEQLYPKEACDTSKKQTREQNIKINWPDHVTPHPIRNARRASLDSLKKRLSVEQYDLHPSIAHQELVPDTVLLPLKQSTGVPAEPITVIGDMVHQGDLIAQTPNGALGCNIHASISGVVTNIDTNIRITRDL